MQGCKNRVTETEQNPDSVFEHLRLGNYPEANPASPKTHNQMNAALKGNGSNRCHVTSNLGKEIPNWFSPFSFSKFQNLTRGLPNVEELVPNLIAPLQSLGHGVILQILMYLTCVVIVTIYWIFFRRREPCWLQYSGTARVCRNPSSFPTHIVVNDRGDPQQWWRFSVVVCRF